MKCHKNKMSVFNLGVVFGPTLLRAVEETLAAILDIKFNNVVIEILIENYDLIFKNAPGKSTDYLTHSTTSSPPEPVPRTYGGYRSSRNSLNNAQPVVRVVTRSNYTDTVMSSSLQNIPNGLGIYQNTGKNVKNHHPIYESKLHMNQSTPSLNRDLNHAVPTREISISREPNYITSTPPNANNHVNNQSPIHRSGGGGQVVGPTVSPHHPNHLNNRDKLLHGSRETNLGRDPISLTSAMSRSTNDGIYGQTRLNPMNYSESNLVHPISIVDRINSTSSSNESVCSTSSLNHSYTTRPPPPQQGQPPPPMPTYLDYNNTNSSYIRDDASQSFMPKKTQRTKDISRQRYHSPRDNV